MSIAAANVSAIQSQALSGRVTLEEIDVLFRHVESELEAEFANVREAIGFADKKLFAAEEMIGLPEDPMYQGISNWPGRIARMTKTLHGVEVKQRERRAREGYNARAAAWTAVRKEKLQRAQTCCIAVTRLVEAVRRHNGGLLP